MNVAALPADPLIPAIVTFHAGNEAYSNHPIIKNADYTDKEEEPAANAGTCGPADDAVKSWSGPATTYESAIAALKLAQYEYVERGMSSSTVANSMLDTALGFLDAEVADPVVEMARRWSAAEQHYQDMESREFDSEKQGRLSALSYYKRARMDAYDAALAQRDAIPHTKATSFLGAIVCLHVANIALDGLLDDLHESAETRDARRVSRMIEKCLYSAVDVIERRTGVRLEDVFLPEMCCRHLNPWLPVEERCPELKREQP